MGMQTAQNVADSTIGLALGALNDKRQLKQQRRLQDLQLEGNKTLQERQLQMWKDTSYPAQKEQMEKAGLNPALMYGMGGGGGQTTGSLGLPTGGQAPSGSHEAIDMSQLGIQRSMAEAQIQVMESQADLNKATAEKTRGVDTAEGEATINKLAADVENINAQKKLTQIDTELRQVQASVSRQTINDQMRAIENIANKGSIEISQLQLSNQLDQSTMDDKIKLLRQQVITAGLEAQLTDAKITHTKAQVEEIAAKISQGWEGLDNQAKQIQIQKFTAEFQANHPGLMNALGGAVQRLADAVSKPTGERKVEYKHK